MKKDKILTRAIIISVAVHLVAIVFIGSTSGTRLNRAIVKPVQQRLLNVNLVKDPLSDPPKPKPVVVPSPRRDSPVPQPTPNVLTPIPGRRVTSPAGPHSGRTNPGGPLNTGTNSARGDIPNLGNGKTPVGYVPSDSGNGRGHGNDPGTNTPEPPIVPVVVPTPVPTPVPIPTPPPPKKVTVTVCDDSGKLAGEHCKGTHKKTFDEGDEPKRTCDKCKAPEPVRDTTRRAVAKDPVLTHDVHPKIPDSVDEGLSLTVEVEYYVDTDGGVSGVRITRSSGNRDLDRAVTSAASQWRYNPGVQDGIALKVKMTRVIRCKT